MTVHSPALPETAETLGELRALLGDRLLTEDSILDTYLSDFGRMVERRPAAVARCTSAAEVAEVIRFCRKHGMPVVPRGQAHTQTGQSTVDGGIVIDTALLNTIHEIDDQGLYADCGAGVVWRDLVKTAIDRGLVPPTLTNNLGVTIAGTTSMAGLGVASFRNGSQADNAIEIEVVTGEGEIVVCSHEKHRELFDSVRCTLGQIGIITRVKTRLRPAKSTVRQYSLVYDDLSAFMADAKKVMDGTTFASMGG
ncbi:MAG TPA: FAD-binding protein, partial [Thermoanaerobaculia bacterium]|nr:FAD-binding protein [Thermoanaerobaculia bacterium]